MYDLDQLELFEDKDYRDGFMHTAVRGGIALQVQALRAKSGETQAEFAQKTGKKQSVISRLEDTEYGRVSVQTLLDVASANDVALLVKFVSYPVFLRQTEDMSESALQPDSIFESLGKTALFVEVSNPSIFSMKFLDVTQVIGTGKSFSVAMTPTPINEGVIAADFHMTCIEQGDFITYAH